MRLQIAKVLHPLVAVHMRATSLTVMMMKTRMMLTAMKTTNMKMMVMRTMTMTMMRLMLKIVDQDNCLTSQLVE